MLQLLQFSQLMLLTSEHQLYVPVHPCSLHQENIGAWSKVVLNAPGPPRGVVVPVVHLVHSDPF